MEEEKEEKTEDLIQSIDDILSTDKEEKEDIKEIKEVKEDPQPPISTDRTDIVFIMIIGLMHWTPLIKTSMFYYLLSYVHLDFNLLLVFIGLCVKALYMLIEGKDSEKRGFLKTLKESLSFIIVYNMAVNFYLLTFIYHLMEQSHTRTEMVFVLGFLHVFITGLAIGTRIELFYLHFFLIMLFPINDPVYLGCYSSLQRVAMGSVLFILDVYFFKIILGGDYGYLKMLNMLMPIWKTPLVVMYIYTLLYIIYRVNFIYYRWSVVLKSLENFKKRLGWGLIGGNYERVNVEEEEEEEEEEDDEDIESYTRSIRSLHSLPSLPSLPTNMPVRTINSKTSIQSFNNPTQVRGNGRMENRSDMYWRGPTPSRNSISVQDKPQQRVSGMQGGSGSSGTSAFPQRFASSYPQPSVNYPVRNNMSNMSMSSLSPMSPMPSMSTLPSNGNTSGTSSTFTGKSKTLGDYY